MSAELREDSSKFEGMTINGTLAKVYSRGELVVDTTVQPDKFVGATGRGSFLRHKANSGSIA